MKKTKPVSLEAVHTHGCLIKKIKYKYKKK